jgi:co-chaperonin GroES (HSP10)
MTKKVQAVVPKRNWLIVREEEIGKTKGGIILPTKDGKSVRTRYVVDTVSEDVEMKVAPGDEIFTVSEAIQLKALDEELKDLLMIRESDIMAVVKRG